ncbi:MULTISPECIES: hypothetical protein [Actinoalloteichus]|uniref:TrbL/VirB6 plasmid conjugal transfer protein n=2 Tax=Actinoalloteichus cyanogriseus TaxID=2893586 RepID=A0ABT1JHG2_ACTCY|nr:hypothetical protein [Actinoalloteichus caeruleus]MCP2331945.1 hypothetical protein [Actinoalloteichus caeruleus DSM 43889]
MTAVLVLAVVGALVALAALRTRARDTRRAEAPPPGTTAPAPEEVLARRTGRRRRGVLGVVVLILAGQVVLGGQAHAQDSGCRIAPNPERPGAGMVGALDPAPIGRGVPGTVYDEVGYAGLVWHTYDLGCGPEGMRNPNAVIDTWAGNQLFNVGKNIVGATIGLHYALLTGTMMAPLDDLVVTGTNALYNTVYTPWFGLVAVVLGVLLFRYIWRGELATISKRGLWALAGMWLAAATYLTPLIYTHLLDDLLIKGTSAIQGGFLEEVGVDERNALPSVLHQHVIYDNWLRGEFGANDAPQAEELGRDLVRAQAWTKDEVAQNLDAGSPDEKKAEFHELATQMGSTYGYFQGVDGSRMGAGFLAMVQSVAYALFQLLAKAAILLAQVLLRVLILAGPIIGLVAMIHHDILRRIGRAAGATLLNVVVVAALAGLHTMVLNWLFSPARGFDLLTQMLLAGLITLVLFMIAKPVRRIWQMIELSAGAVGAGVPGAPQGLLSRWRKRPDTTPQDRFWEQVREGEDDATPGPVQGRGRVRPEGTVPPVNAAVERLDRRAAAAALPVGATAARADPNVPPEGGVRASTSSPALPPGRRSRITDTSPVTDRGWDRVGEDAVIIPSQVPTSPGPTHPTSPAARQPRRAEMEMVAGRPVFVVYRPSRGLEVRDDGGSHPS